MNLIHRTLQPLGFVFVCALLFASPASADERGEPGLLVPQPSQWDRSRQSGWQPATQPQLTPPTNGRASTYPAMVRLPDLSEEEEPDERPLPVDTPLMVISTDIQPGTGELPRDEAVEKFQQSGEMWHGRGVARPWSDSQVCWDASGFRHRPLYFEDVNLERHGYCVRYVQPLVSAAKFYGTIPALPYLMTLDPPKECVYALGDYRPGSCAPLQVTRIPLSARPATVETLVMLGLIFAIP